MLGYRSSTAALVVGLVGIAALPADTDAQGNTNMTTIRPTGLMCELLVSPVNARIHDPSPRFAWIVNSNTKNDVQTAYQVLVASDADLLAKDTGDAWDSGTVRSDESSCVRYAGKGLQPNTSYYWKVRAWNSSGRASAYSNPQTFTMGSMSKKRIVPRHPLEKHEVAPVRVVRVGADKAFIDFGRAAFATVKLTLTGKTDRQKIEVHVGEVAAGDAAVNRRPGGSRRYRKMTLFIEKGTHTYTVKIPPDKRNTRRGAIKMPKSVGEVTPFRYCEVVGYRGNLNPSMIRQVVVHYRFDDSASEFKSSSKVLNDVWELCKYSIKATSFCGAYVDGDRERIPYEADAYINQLGHYCVDREYALARYTHEYLMWHPTWPTEWILHSVLLAWADYVYTGNDASLAHCYDDLHAKTLCALAGKDGLISTCTGLVTKELYESIHLRGKLRDIVDWPHGKQGGVSGVYGETDGYVFTDVNTVVNAFHYRTLVLMSRIAGVLGKTNDVTRYAKRAQRVKRAFNAKLFDKARGVYVDGTGTTHASLHANMFALSQGLVPDDRVETVTAFIKSRGMACSVYGAQFLLEALYRGGAADHALSLMTSRSDRSWAHMIEVGSTITLEAWDNKYKPNQDWNHAWGAAPANIIPRLLMGIEPIEPGFKKIRIRPRPGSLKWARMTCPTIRGPVHVAFKQVPGVSFSADVTIPANTTASVYLPRIDLAAKSVVVDGKQRKATVAGRFLLVEGVGSGSHKFDAR